MLFHNWLVIRFLTRFASMVSNRFLDSVSLGSMTIYFGLSLIHKKSRKLLGVSLLSIFLLTWIRYPSAFSQSSLLFFHESWRLSKFCPSVLKFFTSGFLSITLIVMSLIVRYPYASTLLLSCSRDAMYRDVLLNIFHGCSSA